MRANDLLGVNHQGFTFFGKGVGCIRFFIDLKIFISLIEEPSKMA